MKKPNTAHFNVLKTSRTKLIINGTSIQRRANGLAKFARFDEVSLYRGSFSYTLLLLGERNSFVITRTLLFRD